MVVCDLNLPTYTKDKIIRTQKKKISRAFVAANLYFLENSKSIQCHSQLKIKEKEDLIKIIELAINKDAGFIYEPLSNSDNLFDYINKNIGFMKLFFVKVRKFSAISMLVNQYCAKGNCNSIENIIKIIDSCTEQELFIFLINALNTHTDMPIELASHIIQRKSIFLMYLQGASYSSYIKEELWNLYVSSNLYIKKGMSLRDNLIGFLKELKSLNNCN